MFIIHRRRLTREIKIIMKYDGLASKEYAIEEALYNPTHCYYDKNTPLLNHKKFPFKTY